MTTIRLGDYLTAPTDGLLDGTPYEQLEKTDLADFLAVWDDWHRQALTQLPHRIHPTAWIHPTAIIGDDVIIGPNVRVWEFSTVRGGSLLCAGVSVGFNCEVTRSVLCERAILGHRIGINRTLVGADAHLSANLTVAAISMWSPHMSKPEREIILRIPAGLYRCGTPQFGALKKRWWPREASSVESARRPASGLRVLWLRAQTPGSPAWPDHPRSSWCQPGWHAVRDAPFLRGDVSRTHGHVRLCCGWLAPDHWSSR